MSFLCDHCVWKPTLHALRTAHIPFVTLHGLGRAEARNGEVFALATERREVLMTRDSDFIELALSPRRNHAGVIFLEIRLETMDAVHATLIEALGTVSREQLHGALLIVSPTTYRLHQPI